MNIESLTNLFKEFWTLEIIVILIGITCRHEGLARIKPLRARRSGPQILLGKVHIHVLNFSRQVIQSRIIYRQVVFVFNCKFSM